jgi:hypothetical protein
VKNRRLRLPLWARVVLVLLVTALFGILGSGDESAGLARWGFPMTCFVDSAWDGTSHVVWHALAVDIVFWAALVGVTWIWTGPAGNSKKKIDDG